MQREHRRAEPQSALLLNQMTCQGSFQITLLHDQGYKWPNSEDAHLSRVLRSIHRQRPWFLNKSLIPSSGLKFKHKCCCKSSHRCSDVLALGSRGIGSVAAGAPKEEAGIRLSVELSAGCKAKKQETHTFQTNTNSYTKEKPYTVIEVLTLPQDRISRKGEGRSLHEKAQLKKYFPRS